MSKIIYEITRNPRNHLSLSEQEKRLKAIFPQAAISVPTFMFSDDTTFKVVQEEYLGVKVSNALFKNFNVQIIRNDFEVIPQ